jgi:hypothetical protein
MGPSLTQRCVLHCLASEELSLLESPAFSFDVVPFSSFPFAPREGNLIPFWLCSESFSLLIFQN